MYRLNLVLGTNYRVDAGPSDMRNRYTNEFKAKVVLELLREEKTAAQIAAEYGVHPTQLAQAKPEP